MKDFHKKLTVLCTCFVDEFNLLFVSSSNNIIQTWKFVEQSFKNINTINESGKNAPVVIKNSTIYSCPLFSEDLPQNDMDWNPVQKKLYSGEGNEKILVWHNLKSKGKEESYLDFKKAKEKHDRESSRRSTDDLFSEMEKSGTNTKNNFRNNKKNQKMN